MKESGVIITCLVALVLTGCAATTRYSVRIRSISDAAHSAGTNYVLRPGTKDVSSADRQFGELAGYVRRMLAELDYTEVKTPDVADIVVLLRYGLDTSSMDRDRLARRTLYMTGGAVPVVPAVAYVPVSTSLSSSGLAYAPPYAEVAPLITPVTAVYSRWLSLEAVDAHASEKVTLWKVAAVESGYYPDLEKLFPIMLAACEPFIGRTTKKEVVVYLREDDEEVSIIRGDSAP